MVDVHIAMSHQPIITVEHHHHGGSPDRRGSDGSAAARPASSPGGGGSRRLSKSGSQDRGSGAEHQQQPNLLGESGLSANLHLNLNVRRKSSPCIGGLPFRPSKSAVSSPSKQAPSSSSHHQQHHQHQSGGGHHSRHHHHRNSKGDGGNLLKLELSPTSSSGKYHQRRRLSSPPSFDPGEVAGGSGHNSSGSNHSSGAGSLQQLAIGGLNASRCAGALSHILSRSFLAYRGQVRKKRRTHR